MNSRSLPVFGFTRGDTSMACTLEIRRMPPPSIPAIMSCIHPSTVAENRMLLPSGVNSGVPTAEVTGLMNVWRRLVSAVWIRICGFPPA